MNSQRALPLEFEDLEPFVQYWLRDTNDERWQQRSKASMEEILKFYEPMLARAEDVLAYLEQFKMDDNMPPDATRLFKLLLSLAQAAIAVEMHGQPRARHSPFPHRIRVTHGPAPYGGAENDRDIMNAMTSE